MKGDSSKVTIIEPGIVKAIDGKEYYNDKRIIAGHPDDVAAYHSEQESYADAYCKNEAKLGHHSQPNQQGK